MFCQSQESILAAFATGELSRDALPSSATRADWASRGSSQNASGRGTWAAGRGHGWIRRTRTSSDSDCDDLGVLSVPAHL